MENVKFSCRLETVAKEAVAVSLFQGAKEQGGQEENKEFLLHLEAEVKEQGQEKVQEAEFIVVVDRSGSMNGTPWRQVQGALEKMLELTQGQGNVRTRVITYNHQAAQLPLTGEINMDSAAIRKIRAAGSTSFVAVFNELSAIFKDKKEDATKAFFVFFMTDGEDTCSNAQEIMKQKEMMQTDIEKFGAEVVFHVLGFSEQHDEQFLESLTFLGTSDGSYSFVTPSEGDKAVEERLVQLVQTTSSLVGRSINIEMKSKDLLFLGDAFGEGKTEVVVPAMVSRQGDVVRIATKKFVKKTAACRGRSPVLELSIYEKLTGQPRAISATVAKMEEVILDTETLVADHNLKKLRTALNMITGLISEADKPEQVEGMKVWHKIVQEKFSKMNLDDKEVSPPMRNRIAAVRSGIQICEQVYAEGANTSERERCLQQQSAMNSYQMASNQVHNRKQVKSKASPSNMWLGSKAGRSSLQTKSKGADYTLDDFVLVDNQKK